MNLRHFFTGAAILLAVSGSAAAQGADGALLQALGGCAGLSDNAARLACYDRLAPQVKAALAVPAAVAPTAVAPPAAPAAPAAPAMASAQKPAAKDQSSWFGLDMSDVFGSSSSPEKQTTPTQFGADQLSSAHQQTQTPAHEIDSISAHVHEYAMNPFGKFIVFLDNGQVWRELSSESSRVSFRHDAKANTVMIERGMLGSYILHLNGDMRGYKVERIK